MQTIKITSADKGKNHWEKSLLANQETRLNNLLSQLGTDPWTKRKVITLFKDKIDKDNIIPVFTHPIRVFLQNLLNDNIDYLINNSTSCQEQ